VALVQVVEDDPPAEVDVVAATWTRALALRDLLKYEFFFATKGEFDAQLRYETDLVRPGWAEESATPGEITELLAKSQLLLAHRVIGPFLEAYSVVADRLVTREPAAPLDGDGLVAESLGVAHQRWLQQELHSPESISKDLMGGALKLAGNRSLLGPGGDELIRSRQELADELRAAVDAIAVVRSCALKG
jgi:glycerol-3-phosphate O-acyltransferase